jgi:ABC-type multidrug transport system ATPase subunit
VSARGIELNGPWGKVFGPLDLDLDSGMSVLAAPPGAARTALLMAICGRMKLNAGDLTVLGHRNQPRAVMTESAIAGIDELDSVEPSVTIEDLVTEQLRWQSRWYRWVPRATTDQVWEMCGYLFAGLRLPPIDAFVSDLPEVEQLLVRIAIANTRRPPVLVVGPIDQIAENAQREFLMETLVRLAREQSVVTADVNAHERPRMEVHVVDVPQLLEFQQRRIVASELVGGGDATVSAPGSSGRERGA